MAVKETKNGKPAKDDIERYRENYLSEQEGVYLYRSLAEVESDAQLACLLENVGSVWRDGL